MLRLANGLEFIRRGGGIDPWDQFEEETNFGRAYGKLPTESI